MSGHFLRLFLAHGAAKQIGTTQRIATNNLGDQHDLLLVDDHAIGALERGLQVRVEIIDRRAAMLAVDEVIDHARLQGARAVEREHRDDVFEIAWPQLFQQLLHAA